MRVYVSDGAQGDGYIKNTLSLLSRSDFSTRLQFGSSERALVVWCNLSNTRVNAYEKPLSASQETNCVHIDITRRLKLFNKQNCR